MLPAEILEDVPAKVVTLFAEQFFVGFRYGDFRRPIRLC
jgi:hypothetical protein